MGSNQLTTDQMALRITTGAFLLAVLFVAGSLWTSGESSQQAQISNARCKTVVNHRSNGDFSFRYTYKETAPWLEITFNGLSSSKQYTLEVSERGYAFKSYRQISASSKGTATERSLNNPAYPGNSFSLSDSRGYLLRLADFSSNNTKYSNVISVSCSDYIVPEPPRSSNNSSSSTNKNSSGSGSTSTNINACSSITSRTTCLAKSNPYCEYANNACQMPSCGALLNRLGKTDSNRYEFACGQRPVAWSSITFAGPTSDCGNNNGTREGYGCFYRVKVR